MSLFSLWWGDGRGTRCRWKAGRWADLSGQYDFGWHLAQGRRIYMLARCGRFCGEESRVPLLMGRTGITRWKKSTHFRAPHRRDDSFHMERGRARKDKTFFRKRCILIERPQDAPR
ncbi:hypothetical protein LMH87_007089 [Akanthomyces muscarius]|uniref:Uncharacterized protein n=1 Tax=Akanthomyces muscarius TaxID=2231603 RepID=A0A9W8UQZ1_AKAMU|nr:hypothetical protein LMH87_007089 [Akanthomyces muscarius]KAJ4165457.1 hypothetical protein LMH87_007089 [Akanthomyces muscarius]